MTRLARLRTGLPLLALMVLAACNVDTTQEDLPPSCPRVDAVEGLDRLSLTYPGSSTPVRTGLDIIDVGCELEGDSFVVGAAIAVRVSGNRPPGELQVALTVVIDTPQGMTPSRAETVIIPPGTMGTVEIYEHRFPASVAEEDVLVRVLYALVPDSRELERISRERPRP